MRVITEAEYERIVDRRVQSRIAWDARYVNAESVQHAIEVGIEIEEQVCAEVEAEYETTPWLTTSIGFWAEQE